MATSDIEIFPKTQLQEDWYTQSIRTSSIADWAVNLDRNGKLTTSFIQNGTVFSAYRNLDKDGNAVRAWTIDDTQFPSSTQPRNIVSILSPSNTTFLAVIGEDSNLYILDSSSRFPHWELCDNKPTDLSRTLVRATRSN
ncbi:hypothetical protein BYT27DRAFT_7260436 [Phlegmacium glaucopus]|nr:hypothetical protein BYT27DRAFT_7260436 [Phlegmacium glaucopus]